MSTGHSDAHSVFDALQAAAAKAPQLSKEEMKKLRQERDPHFKGGMTWSKFLDGVRSACLL